MATQSTLESRRSRSSSYRKPTSVPVSRQPLSFSISNILGLDDDRSLSQASSNSEPLKYFAKSSSLHSDITSSSSDCESEYDQQLPNPSEKPSKKRRQRTTFSAQEVWAMERAFRRSPYLRGEDETALVQRLEITAKSLRFWFQNRRAKSKRERRDKPGVCQISLSRRLECPAGLRLPVQCHPHASTASQITRIRIEQVGSEDQPRFHAPIVEDLYYPSIVSNQFRRTVTDPNDQPLAKLQLETANCDPSESNQLRIHSFGLPMFHPDQLKYKEEAKSPRKRRYSRASKRFQPHLM